MVILENKKEENQYHIDSLHQFNASPALLSLQQLPVGGNLNIQSQFDIEEVLVLLQMSRHLLLQGLDLLLQTAHSILVTGCLHGAAVLHLPQLAFQ